MPLKVYFAFSKTNFYNYILKYWFYWHHYSLVMIHMRSLNSPIHNRQPLLYRPWTSAAVSERSVGSIFLHQGCLHLWHLTLFFYQFYQLDQNWWKPKPIKKETMLIRFCNFVLVWLWIFGKLIKLYSQFFKLFKKDIRNWKWQSLEIVNTILQISIKEFKVYLYNRFEINKLKLKMLTTKSES